MKEKEQNTDRQLLIDFLRPSIDFFIDTKKDVTNDDLYEIKQKIEFEFYKDDKLKIIQKEFENLKIKYNNLGFELSYYATNPICSIDIADYLVEFFPKLVEKNYIRYKDLDLPMSSNDYATIEEKRIINGFHAGKFVGYIKEMLVKKGIIDDLIIYNFLKDYYKLLTETSTKKIPKKDDDETSEDSFLQAFFAPENDILPPEDYLKYKNLLYSETKKIIDIQKEPWKVFAVLMVWSEKGKLDLSEFNKERKSKELNVKVSHYMAKYFTVEGKNRENSYYNSDVFHSLISLINEKSGFKHRKFMERLNTICGKLEFDLPEKLKYLP